MPPEDAIRCARCGRETPSADAVRNGEQLVCEDCLMDLMSPAKACDPWAVKMAKSSMGTTADATASLRGLEKALYELVRARGRVLKPEVPSLLGVTPEQVDRAFAVLRHMELLRGERGADASVAFVPFSDPQP